MIKVLFSVSSWSSSSPQSLWPPPCPASSEALGMEEVGTEAGSGGMEEVGTEEGASADSAVDPEVDTEADMGEASVDLAVVSAGDSEDTAEVCNASILIRDINVGCIIECSISDAKSKAIRFISLRE